MLYPEPAYLCSWVSYIDDHYVIALTDANFAQYNISEHVLARAMNRHPKVKTALICICEDSDAAW